MNTKSNFKIDEKNTLFLSGYFGRDKFSLNNTFSNTYGNSTFNLRWNHLINDKTFSNTSLIYSDYYYGLTLDFIGFNWNSGIKNLNIKFDLKNYFNENIQFNYGLNSIYYEFNPGEIKPIENSGINYKNLNKKYALENSAYFDVIQKVSRKVSLRYGLRFNQFLRFKQNGLNTYLESNPVNFDSTLGIYKGADPIGEYNRDKTTIKEYGNIEPRINLAYNFNNSSLKFSYNKLKHAIPNFFFTSTTILINFSLAFLLLKSSDWVSNNYFGLIHLYDFPLWIKVIFGILLLDLVGAYLAHYVEHNVKFLWMIHLVHHSDHKVDTTTANRHHPLESLIRFSFTLLGVFVSGVPIGDVMLYQSLSIISTQFTHANNKLSKKLDKFISYIFVSPDMHKIHHHFRLPYTDKNYGNIFSIWDRIFGTYLDLDREKLIYGVDVFPDEKKNSRIKSLLIQPFQKYQKPTLSKEV